MRAATQYAHRTAARTQTRTPCDDDVVMAAHTYTTATRLLPLITREFGDTPQLQAARRVELDVAATHTRKD